MLLILLPTLYLVAILLIIVVIVLYLYRRSVLRALAPAPAPRPPVDCALPAGPLPAGTDPDIVLTGNERDRDIRGRTIQLPQGAGFNLPPGSLTLVAYGDLTIDGPIPIVLGSGDSLTLASVTGTVTIGPSAVIGLSGPATAPAPGPATGGGLYALARGAPGTTGGTIKIIAPLVIIEGKIGAEPGGGGGLASAIGTGMGPIGGTAVAVGGRGGFGGTVLICAEEEIQINEFAAIRAGNGGVGGTAVATASNGSRAPASGGTGNDGGDAIFTGTGPGPCQVTVTTLGSMVPPIKAGNGGNGGLCTATGGPGVASAFTLLVGGGGPAEAFGGLGGAGGTVRFVNCEVSPVASITAGSGGVGGAATAAGGTGAAAIAFTGYAGGDANAEGGDGGLIGAPEPYPLIGGGTATVAPPFVPGGSGGNASGTGGIGGTGGGSPFFSGGGDSGEADAVGGSNPNSGATAVPATSAPVAGIAGGAGAGGIGPLTTSRGAP